MTCQWMKIKFTEPSSKLLKQLRKLAEGYEGYFVIVPLSFARGIIQLADITVLRL
jgi:hypothetical protein